MRRTPTGRPATTRTPGSTRRSRPPATPAFPCWDWIRRTRAAFTVVTSATPFPPVPTATTLCLRVSGGRRREAGARLALKVWCVDGVEVWRAAARRGEVPDRGGGCHGHARVQDDRVPAGALRRAPGGARRAVVPGRRGRRARLSQGRLLPGRLSFHATHPGPPQTPRVFTNRLGTTVITRRFVNTSCGPGQL